ncbi:MAG: hypothetical protein ACK4S4_14995 [Pyrinomonadaceae bacterium]
MNTLEQKLSPVVVVMDHNTTDCKQIRRWFENSRFTTLEADDVFQAIGELSDFTVESAPDVILLNVDCCDDDMPFVLEMVGSVGDEIPVIALTRPTGKGDATYFAGDLSQAVSRLESMFPAPVLN